MRFYTLFVFCSCFFVRFAAAQNNLSITWQKALGGSGYETCNHMELTSDGGSILIGTTNSTDGDVTGSKGSGITWLVKLDSIGNIQWKSLFDGDGISVKQTTDKGYILAGSYPIRLGMDLSTSDCWLVKTDSVGNIQWEKRYGGSEVDGATSVIQTADGNFLMCGSTTSTDGDVSGIHTDNNPIPNNDCWLVKINTSGNIIWQKCLGGSSSDQASNIIQTSDGGFFMVGSTSSSDGDVKGYHPSPQPVLYTTIDGWAVKLDTAANIQWQKCLGGGQNDLLNDAKQSAAGFYILAGTTGSNDGDVTTFYGGSDSWLINLDAKGNMLWQTTYGGSGGEETSSVEITPDGGYLVTSSSGSGDGEVTGNHIPAGDREGKDDYWIFKTDSLGTLQWEKTLGGTNFDYAVNGKQLSDSSYLIAGTTLSTDGDVAGIHTGNFPDAASDYWIVKLNSGLSVLPIHFLSFTGKGNGNQNILHWTIDNNSGSGIFEIQRSANGQIFINIGSLTYTSESPQTNFSFNDNNISLGYYYRIQQIEKTGPFIVSPVIYLVHSSSSSSLTVTIYPNPAKDMVGLNIVSPETQVGTISITDFNDRILFVKSININKGQNNIAVPINKLSAGNYLIKLIYEAGAKRKILRFIKE